MTYSNWPQAVPTKKQGRLILFMRSAERVDRVFGSEWCSTEAPHRVLIPTDLNVPNNVMINQLFDSGVLFDNPTITTLGRYSTVLVARAMHNRGVIPKMIVCSPALRAVQTGDELAKHLHARLAIEPGLVEPLAWYRRPGKETLDFRLDESTKHYVFDTKHYRTIIPMEEIVKLYATESEAKGLSRVDRVVRTLAGEERKNPLVIVAHAITLAIATTLDNSSQIASFDNHSSVRLLDNDVIDRVNIGLRFPPGSVIALTQINEASPFIYELFPNIVPPLSYGEFYSNEPAVEI